MGTVFSRVFSRVSAEVNVDRTLTSNSNSKELEDNVDRTLTSNSNWKELEDHEDRTLTANSNSKELEDNVDSKLTANFYSKDLQDDVDRTLTANSNSKELEDELGFKSIDKHLDIGANVSDPKNCVNGNQLKFTRSWSFEAPAEERKVTLSDLTRRSSLKEDVFRAVNRSWSFTKTLKSLQPEENSNVLEVISLDDGDGTTAEEVQEAVNGESPMPLIDENDEAPVEDFQEVEEPAAKEYKVRPLAKSFVVPAEPVEKRWLPLSNLDRVVNPTFSSVIHYYNNVLDESRSFSNLTTFLKETLAKTLVVFYPLAGRLMLHDDGKVDLYCNNDGAVWIEATVDSELKDIGGLQPNHRLSGLDVARLGPGPLFIPDQLTAMPVLIIQITKFRCGTIAIATSWHHTVADGFSGTHFMGSWAEVAQGKAISKKPVHSREILKARDPPNPTMVNGYSTATVEDLCPQAAKVCTSAPAKLSKFDLNQKAIDELKKRANLEPPPPTHRPYSSAESISAHLWRQMTKARATANSYDGDVAAAQSTKFFMFVDGRKRLHLPEGYFGNVVCSACAVAKEADILDKPLHYAASLIRTATWNITEEYFKSLIDWVEIQGMSSSKSEHVNSLGHDVAATFWTFFPLYDIEFGWGKPVFAARNSPPRPLIDGIAMMPAAEGKGMVALLNLHSDRMSKLQKQISFATVFH